MRISQNKRGRVPWLELALRPTKYLDVDTIPNDFKVLDPSKLTNDMVKNLLHHWTARARAKLPILIFTAARNHDPAFRAQLHPNMRMSWKHGKRKANDDLSLSSDDQASNDELEDGHAGKHKGGADKGEGNPGPSARQPPSKRPRLFKQPAIPEEQSPASNNNDRRKYLYSLSSEPCYRTLLDGVLALPVLVSPFFFLHLYGFV